MSFSRCYKTGPKITFEGATGGQNIQTMVGNSHQGALLSNSHTTINIPSPNPQSNGKLKIFHFFSESHAESYYAGLS